MKCEKLDSFPCRIFSDKFVDIELAKESIRRRDCNPEVSLAVEDILGGIDDKSNKAKIVNISVPVDLYAEISFLLNKANDVLFGSYGLSMDEFKLDSTLFDQNCYFISFFNSEESVPEGVMLVNHVGPVRRNVIFDCESRASKSSIVLQRPRFLTISQADFLKLDNFKNRLFALLQGADFDCHEPLYSFHLSDFLHQKNISGCISFVARNKFGHFSLLVHPDTVSELKITEVIDDFSPCSAKQDFTFNMSLLSKVSYEIDSYFIEKANCLVGGSS
jgi:hypothetical protein